MLMSTLLNSRRCQLALMVQKVGASAPAIDYHSQQMALPASTQKVITALAALIQLGPDFRFTTTLETKGNVENGVLKGDLVARFACRSDVKTSGYSQYGHDFEKSGVNQIGWQCADRYLPFSPATIKPPAGHGMT